MHHCLHLSDFRPVIDFDVDNKSDSSYQLKDPFATFALKDEVDERLCVKM